MDNSEKAASTDCEMPQQSLPLENNLSLANEITDPSKDIDQNRNSENQTSKETTDNSFQNVNVAPETSSVVSSSDNSMPPLPPLPKGDKELPQPPVPYSADYNMQNYANYNYMYNYNNYYGYPYPQYQWDYNSQQYYQPYQNYYNYNYNTSSTQTAKPLPPPLNSVQLPVEEKPANKTNATTVEDSNRYSPTAEPDDDDNIKVGLSENNKSDICVKPSSTCPTPQTTSLTNSVPLQNVSSVQIENSQNISENIENKIQQPIVPLIIPVQPPIVPVIAPQLPSYNIPVQQPSYPVNPQIKTHPTEAVNELTTPQKNSVTLNGKDDSVEKLSKAVTVLGKNQAKKRLMAFSMMKQKLQEQSNSTNDNQGSDICEGNDVEFIPELNVFQTATKKKVVTNKKVIKVIKAQQTIEQIEEMKKDELLQGNNAALYQHLLRSSGNDAPILQKLGIESLAEKYSAKFREQDKRLKRHHHRHRDDRRSHKHRRHSKSRSRSRSKSAEKPKMRALEVKSWKDFIDGGFHFDKFRRFKLDETEEMKGKERKSKSKKKHRDSRSDGKNQNTESIISTEKESKEHNLRYNLLDRKKEILKGLEVITHEGGDCTKDFPSYLIQHTKSKPVVKYSQNPAKATHHFYNRQQMLATLLPEVEAIVHKFLSSMKPKRLKENPIENYNYVDEKLLVIMKDKNIYPFKGWWPKQSFIVTQVKEDPNIEIDNNALINEFTTNKRTKKSRFNDDPLVDLRPTVPSKWDSDYDGSPAADKVMDVEVSQNVEMNTNDVRITNREESNLPDISHQGKTRDISKEEPKIEVNICPIVPTPFQKPQAPAKLATEYEEFLKIVSVEKADEEDENAMPISAIQKENESNLSINLASLNDESVNDKDSENDDTSTKSSDESTSLHNTAEESVDRSYVKSLSSIDKKCKKKKKPSSKKSKKFKKKESRKKKYKSSSSESSEDSESDESDSSSEDESEESTDSCSSVEKKKKKKKLKGRKKKKSKANYKKNYKGNKNKNKKLEDDKDSNSSILNLLEKAFNVEIKKRPIESEEPKKKKRKHEKKEKKSAEDNDDEFEKVKECLKETFSKLVKTDKVKKNQSLSCDDTTVGEVLKYLKIDKEKLKKNKKSKKSSKRKYDSDNSDDEKPIKRSRLDNSLKLNDSEKKKKKKKKLTRKKSVDSDEYILKEKSKKKSKTPETSDTDDENESNYKTPNEEKDSKNFFGQRPNEWNVINKSSMRGVVHHSADKNINYKSTGNISGVDDVKIEKSKFKSLNLNSTILCSSDTESNDVEKPMLSDILKNHARKETKPEKLEICDEYVKKIKDDKLKNIAEEKVQNNFKNPHNASGKKKEHNFEDDTMLDIFDQSDNNEVEHKSNEVPQSTVTKYDYKRQDLNNDINNVAKSSLNKSLELNDKSVVTTIIKPIVPVHETISYRDKVKMNLKKLSTFQDIPFLFGFSSPFNVIKSCSLKKEIIKEDFQLLDEEIKSSEKFADRPKVVICPQTQKTIPNATQIASPKIDMETNNEILDQSINLDNSEKSYSDDSTVGSVNTLDHSSDEDDNEQVNSGLLEECLSSIHDENQKYNNEIFSYNNDLESNEKDICRKVESIFDNKEITNNVSNSADLNKSEHFESSTGVLHDNESIKVISTEKKDSDSVCSQQSSIDLDVTEIELITQWISDWSVLDMSVKENNNKMDKNNIFKVKKTSRWDEQSKDNIINESQKDLDGQEFEDERSNCSIDEINTTSAQSDLDIFLERQSQQDALKSLNNLDDSTVYDYYTENWSNEYNEYSQSYDQYYCGPPQYSEMKTIEYDQLSPVDYSVYENYNPDYDCHNENVKNWKSIDTSQSVTDGMSSSQFATDDEMSMPLQVEKDLKILPSENIVTIVPDDQDEELNSERRSEQFFHLYQQYFQHYSQNPIKYSMSNPVLSSTTNVNIGIPDKLLPHENLDDDPENKIVLIPLQDRAYAHILEDDNNILYMTNDNYIAYCAIEDKCMVHIALDSVNRDGIDDKVRHCFNIYQNGPVIEYWLNADLIPFNSSSDSESGVFSDEEAYSEISNTDDEEDNGKGCGGDGGGGGSGGGGGGDGGGGGGSGSGMDNNNKVGVNNDIIEGEWELMESDGGEDKDAWLNDPHVFEKYSGVIDGVGQTMTEISEDESNSSEYDTDASDYFDSNIDTSSSNSQNITVNPFQTSFAENEDNKNNFQNIVDVNTPIDVKQTENISENLDLSIEVADNIILSEQLVLNAETEQVNDTLEEVNKDITLKINTGFNDNVSTEFEEKEKNNRKEQDILLKDGITVADLTMMNTIINQQMLIQRLKIRAKNKIQNKLPDTQLVCYSDNMESVKHPFLGLFQPPTISILSQNQNTKTNKRVTFADGICPGDPLAASPTHDEVGCPLSPPPLKALMRETLKLKRNMYPFKKSKRMRHIKLTMTNKKVAMVNPSIKSADSSSSIRYYIDKCRHPEDIVPTVVNNNAVISDDSSISDNISPSGPIDTTPVPSDNECWNDDENAKNTDKFNLDLE